MAAAAAPADAAAPLQDAFADFGFQVNFDDESDSEAERERLKSIREREKSYARKWHQGGSLPQVSDGVQMIPLKIRGETGDRDAAVKYRLQSFPPHGGDIVKTGGILWDASLVLCKYLEHLRSRSDLAAEGSGSGAGADLDLDLDLDLGALGGKLVVELGAGVAVPSLGAHILGAKEVVVTDVPDRMKLIEQNIELNRGSLHGSIVAAPLTWGNAEELAALERDILRGRRADVILCADVLFNDRALHLLVDTISRLSGPQTVVLSCCEHRWDGALRFYELLKAAGFGRVEPVPTTDQHPDFSHDSIFLYCSQDFAAGSSAGR